MKGLSADCRHAVRLYARTPGASLIAIGVLAVGMAFVGAFLSLYVDLVLRPHPGFEQSNRLATVGQNTGTQFLGMPFEIVERMSDDMASIEAAATWSSASTLLGSEREEAAVGLLSREFFSGLRPRVALGRGFRIEDHAPDAEPVVVLSYRYWQQRFGGNRSALGTFIEIARDTSVNYRGPPGSLFWEQQPEPEEDSAQFRIVGVMAETLPGFPTLFGGSSEPPMWVPLERVWPMFVGVPESLGTLSASAYVRRAPGVSATAVANELRGRYGGPDSSWSTFPGARFDAADGIVGNLNVQRDARRQLEMFIAGSVLLALVAAANVSLFLLARAPGRRRELGIRMAVGAPIRRLARQLATEAGLLVLVAATLGLLGSIWLSVYVRSLALMREAQWRDVTLLDWRVLGLAGVVVLLITLLASLAPVVGLKRLGIAASSRQATARASMAQRLAGTAQIAVAGTLAGAALAFGWHVSALMFGNPGYQVSDRYLVQFGHFRATQSQPAEQLSERDMIERSIIELTRRREVIEAIPGVTAVAFGTPVPGHQFFVQFPEQLSDPRDPANEIEVFTGSFDRAFVDLLRFTLVRGRAPEMLEPGVVLVNQTLARALFGHDDIIGERLPGNPRWHPDGAEIVGVLEDLSFEHPAAPVRPFVFTTFDSLTAIVETQLSAAGLRQAIERVIADGVIDAQLHEIEPLRGLRSELIAPDRARGALTLATATLVLLLAGFGFYGTQRYLVAAGRREYAIRASIGAGPGALGRLVLARGLLLGLPGLVIGGLLAFIAVAWLRDDFVSRDISPGVVTFWVVAGLTLLVLAASVGPAREARHTQPAPWLREE